MPVNPIPHWKQTFKALVQNSFTTAWARAFANWAGDEGDLMQLGAITNAVFVFNRGVFEAELLKLTSPSIDKYGALMRFVDAWEKAILASSLSVAGGSGPDTNITGTGVPTNTGAAKMVLHAKLMSGSTTANIDTSIFPEAFRDGFLALIYLVTGSASSGPFSGSSPTI